jgi:hypothetical protein
MKSLGKVEAGLGGFQETHTEDTMSEAMTQMTQKEAPPDSQPARVASLVAQAKERSAPCNATIERFMSSPHHVPRKFMFAVALAVANLQKKQRALSGGGCPDTSSVDKASPSFRLQQQLVDSSPLQVT